MFGTAQETPYDLHFRLARIPIRVSIWFWVMGAVLELNMIKLGVEFLLAWLVILFVSILVHEMGHALTAKAFGFSPSVLLYQFGGLAFYQPYGKHSRLKTILITLAGPGAGFVLFGLTALFIRYGTGIFSGVPDRYGFLIGYTLSRMLYVNLYWGLINLLPILPLDGGRIAEQLLTGAMPARGFYYAAWLGAVTAGLVALYFFQNQQSYNAILFAMLCASNVSLIQQMNSTYR